jgi:membrane associated rhomboid family serine protease
MLGREVLSDPAALAQLRDGPLPVPTTAGPAAEATEPTPFDIGEAARRAFFMPGRVWVVPLLILVNLVTFAGSFAMAVRNGTGPMDFLSGGDVRTLHQLGAVSAPDIARGEWWRLLTTCFLHFGLMHITLNMTSLFMSRRAEVLWGPGRFLALYLISGFCGSCAAVYFRPTEGGEVLYLAGASGALWGVMTSQIVWLVLNWSHLPPAEVWKWAQPLVVTLLLNVGVSMLPHVSAAAHFGGGAAGALAAFLLRVHKFGAPARRSMAGVLLAFLPALFVLGLSVAMASSPRLQPFMADVYREQIGDRVGKLPPVLDELEPKADRLFLQETAHRDPAEVSKVREGLQALVKQAKEAGEWAKKTDPVDYARPTRERGIGLVDALVPYAEALDKQADGETVGNMNVLRKNWQESRAAWDKVIAK